MDLINKITTLAAAFFAVLATEKMVFITLGVVLVIDLFTSIWKCKKMKCSYKEEMANFAQRIILYPLMLMTGILIDHHIIQSGMLNKIISTFFSLNILKNISNNIFKITGNNLFLNIIEKIKNTFENYSTQEVKDKNHSGSKNKE